MNKYIAIVLALALTAPIASRAEQPPTASKLTHTVTLKQPFELLWRGDMKTERRVLIFRSLYVDGTWLDEEPFSEIGPGMMNDGHNHNRIIEAIGNVAKYRVEAYYRVSSDSKWLVSEVASTRVDAGQKEFIFTVPNSPPTVVEIRVGKSS